MTLSRLNEKKKFMISFDTVINPDAFLTFLFRSKKVSKNNKGFWKKMILKEIKVSGENGLHRNMYNKYMDAYAGSVYFKSHFVYL